MYWLAYSTLSYIDFDETFQMYWCGFRKFRHANQDCWKLNNEKFLRKDHRVAKWYSTPNIYSETGLWSFHFPSTSFVTCTKVINLFLCCFEPKKNEVFFSEFLLIQNYSIFCLAWYKPAECVHDTLSGMLILCIERVHRNKSIYYDFLFLLCSFDTTIVPRQMNQHTFTVRIYQTHIII